MTFSVPDKLKAFRLLPTHKDGRFLASARSSSLLVWFRLWRDAALTAAAFALVLAAAVGAGPFGRPADSTGPIAETSRPSAPHDGPILPRLADLAP